MSARNGGTTELSLNLETISLREGTRASIDFEPEFTYSLSSKDASATKNLDLACNVRWGTFQVESATSSRECEVSDLSLNVSRAAVRAQSDASKREKNLSPFDRDRDNRNRGRGRLLKQHPAGPVARRYGPRSIIEIPSFQRSPRSGGEREIEPLRPRSIAAQSPIRTVLDALDGRHDSSARANWALPQATAIGDVSPCSNSRPMKIVAC